MILREENGNLVFVCSCFSVVWNTGTQVVVASAVRNSPAFLCNRNSVSAPSCGYMHRFLYCFCCSLPVVAFIDLA